jgi:hypothetical protein
MAACAGDVTLGRLGLAGLIFVVAPAEAWASAYEPMPAAASFAYSISHAVTPLPDAVIERTIDRNGVPFDYDDGDSFEHPPDKPHDPRLGPPRGLSRSGVCATIASVAQTYRLPVPFFANLIWQESSFNPRDISRAGALGIAQFMPKTAVSYGLINPFEPIHALNVAARFLRELHGQFGNLGLAAAAYNAGPGRVSNWLAKRGALPGETRNYVIRITGRVADRWTAAKAAIDPEMSLMPAKAPCAEVTAAVEQQAKVVRVGKLMSELVAATAPPEPLVAAKPTIVRFADARSQRGRNTGRNERVERNSGKTKLAEKTLSRRAHVRSGDPEPPERGNAKHAKADQKNLATLKVKSLPGTPRRGVGKRTKIASS